MTKEETIKYLQQLYPNGGHCWLDGQRIAAIDMAIKALQEEPVSEDFEEAMQHNAPDNIGVDDLLYWRNGFITGAKWKTTIVSEDFEEVVKTLWNEMNTGHEYSVIESYNVFYGLCLDIANWQKEQMMAKAIDGDVTFDYYGDDDKTYGCIAHDSFCLEDFGVKDKDKVRMILIKED